MHSYYPHHRSVTTHTGNPLIIQVPIKDFIISRNDKVGHHLGRESSLGKPRLARSELECRAHADLGLAMEQIGEVLEPPLDSLPFEIRIGLR